MICCSIAHYLGVHSNSDDYVSHILLISKVTVPDVINSECHHSNEFSASAYKAVNVSVTVSINRIEPNKQVTISAFFFFLYVICSQSEFVQIKIYKFYEYIQFMFCIFVASFFYFGFYYIFHFCFVAIVVVVFLFGWLVVWVRFLFVQKHNKMLQNNILLVRDMCESTHIALSIRVLS